MQRERGGRNDLFDMGDPFSIFQGFGGFGSNRSMMSSLFGGRDPFDDPFFTRPFGSISGPSILTQATSSSNTPQNNETKGIVIEELDSDHEGEMEEVKGSGDEKYNREMHVRSSREPTVEHPDDDVEVDENMSKSSNYNNQHSKVEGTESQPRSFSYQTCKVTYGGVDGAYYTTTRTRRTDKDGAMLEESKEADKTTGQATHRISRGIHDKGHSVTRKLNSDGKVDTVQTLHNLNEDELAGFEESWKGNAKSGWSGGFDMHRNAGSSGDERSRKTTRGGWLLPATERVQNAGIISDSEARTSATSGRTKKVVRINIE